MLVSKEEVSKEEVILSIFLHSLFKLVSVAFKLLYVAAEMLTVCSQRLADDSLRALQWNRCLISRDRDDGMPFVICTLVSYGFSIMMSEI